MNRIPFAWNETNSLALELSQPIRRLSVESIFPQSGIMAVTLWRADGSGIEISNKMHDLAERIEVGVLQFEKVNASPAYKCIVETVELDSAFLHELKVAKLVIEESGVLAESGVELVAPDGRAISIVASGMPCNLAVQGVQLSAKNHGPEYPLDDYQREAITDTSAPSSLTNARCEPGLSA